MIGKLKHQLKYGIEHSQSGSLTDDGHSPSKLLLAANEQHLVLSQARENSLKWRTNTTTLIRHCRKLLNSLALLKKSKHLTQNRIAAEKGEFEFHVRDLKKVINNIDC